MEDLIYKTVSNNEKFTNQDLQDKLISFEQTVLQKQKNNLAFWVALYEFKRVFSPNNSEYFIQRTEQGKGYYFNEFMEKHFCIDKNTINKICLVVKRFTNYTQRLDVESSNVDNSIQLTPTLFGFSSSKLFELLSLTDKQIQEAIKKGLLKPEMTVKELREYIKSLKGKQKKNEQVEEEEVDSMAEESINVEDELKLFDNYQNFTMTIRRVSKECLIKLLDVALDQLDNYKNKNGTGEDKRQLVDKMLDKGIILKDLAQYLLNIKNMSVSEE